MFVDTGVRVADVARIAQAVTRHAVTWNPTGWGSCAGLHLQQDFGDAVSGTWRLAMLLGLQPGGRIERHRDNPAAENGLDGERLERVHVVLSTNRHCWNLHDGVWQQLAAGHVYTMDPSREHGSLNWGDSYRWHLIVDRAAA